MGKTGHAEGGAALHTGDSTMGISPFSISCAITRVLKNEDSKKSIFFLAFAPPPWSYLYRSSLRLAATIAEKNTLKLFSAPLIQGLFFNKCFMFFNRKSVVYTKNNHTIEEPTPRT